MSKSIFVSGLWKSRNIPRDQCSGLRTIDFFFYKETEIRSDGPKGLLKRLFFQFNLFIRKVRPSESSRTFTQWVRKGSRDLLRQFPLKVCMWVGGGVCVSVCLSPSLCSFTRYCQERKKTSDSLEGRNIDVMISYVR